MVELDLKIGSTFNINGEQVDKFEKICLTNEEASFYLKVFIEEEGCEFAKDWIKEAKGGITIKSL
jgi:hypothetical protein